MKYIISLLCTLLLVAIGANPLHSSRVAEPLSKPGLIEAPTTPQEQVPAIYGQLPLSFEANEGQTADFVQFLARRNGYTLLLAADEAVLRLRPAVVPSSDQQAFDANKRQAVDTAPSVTVRMHLLGANPAAQILGLEEQAGKVNYFIGNDPSRWHTNIPTYAKVRVEDLYSGVDLVYYGNPAELEYDFVVAPGADPSQIQFAFEGIEEVSLDRTGNLVLPTHAGDLILSAPTIYQEVNGVRQEISGGYVLQGQRRVHFQVDAYDTTHPLVIDPVLIYSTYLGGGSNDTGRSIAVDSEGNAYVTGHTGSIDFPASPGAFQDTSQGNADAFVAKLDSTGALVYATYLGGSGNEIGYGIDVDANHNAYVIGYTTTDPEFATQDFPLENPLQSHYGGNTDVFITKLSMDGSMLVYSTYLGGSGSESGGSFFVQGPDIAVDDHGNAYVTGRTLSFDDPDTPEDEGFPLANPLQPEIGGVSDAFVAKLSTDGSTLVYSTYLGGRWVDLGRGIAVDSDGQAHVIGWTSSVDDPETPEDESFPLANPLQPAFGGDHDAFVAKLSADGSTLVYSTYLGGSDDEIGSDIAVDNNGNAYVIGDTESSDDPDTPENEGFPLVDPLQPEIGGVSDAFVAKLSADGSILVYSTYLGGTDGAEGLGIAVDSSGNAYVTGVTREGFPLVNPVQPEFGGVVDAFVARFNGPGTALDYSTYLGGASGDVGHSIAVDDEGNAYVTGITGSVDDPETPEDEGFPLANPFQSNHGGGEDAFVVKIGAINSPQFEYEAKVVCGLQRDAEEMRLVQGFYATTVNIHNPNEDDVLFFKKLALTVPPGEQRAGEIVPIAEDVLQYDEALAVDCMTIRDEVFGGELPTPYIEGFVVIQSPLSLDVVAVYTTGTLNERGEVAGHSSIDVEYVPERALQEPPDLDRADLEIRKEAIIRSTGTTAIVRYRIYVTNHGPAAAQNVVVNDTLQLEIGTLIAVPEGGFSASHGGVWSLGQATQSSAELEATIPALLATEQAVLEFVVVVQLAQIVLPNGLTELQAELMNTASVASDATDLNPGNNSVNVVTSLNP